MEPYEDNRIIQIHSGPGWTVEWSVDCTHPGNVDALLEIVRGTLENCSEMLGRQQSEKAKSDYISGKLASIGSTEESEKEDLESGMTKQNVLEIMKAEFSRHFLPPWVDETADLSDWLREAFVGFLPLAENAETALSDGPVSPSTHGRRDEKE